MGQDRLYAQREARGPGDGAGREAAADASPETSSSGDVLGTRVEFGIDYLLGQQGDNCSTG